MQVIVFAYNTAVFILYYSIFTILQGLISYFSGIAPCAEQK